MKLTCTSTTSNCKRWIYSTMPGARCQVPGTSTSTGTCRMLIGEWRVARWAIGGDRRSLSLCNSSFYHFSSIIYRGKIETSNNKYSLWFNETFSFVSSVCYCKLYGFRCLFYFYQLFLTTTSSLTCIVYI
jgi:hypothetical protein